MVRSGPGKTREKAETGLKGSIKVILLSQVITEMDILQHQSTKQNSFSLQAKICTGLHNLWNVIIKAVVYIFHRACYGVQSRWNVTSWPDQVNYYYYLFPQVEVKKSLLSWACCDAYLAQRHAEGAGHEADEGAFKGHCTQSATSAAVLPYKSTSFSRKAHRFIQQNPAIISANTSH